MFDVGSDPRVILVLYLEVRLVRQKLVQQMFRSACKTYLFKITRDQTIYHSNEMNVVSGGIRRVHQSARGYDVTSRLPLQQS